MAVGIVIRSNRPEGLKNLIESIGDFECAMYVAAEFQFKVPRPHCVFEKVQESIPVGGSWNRGMGIVMNLGCDVVVVAEDDITFTPGFLDEAADLPKHPNIPILAGWSHPYAEAVLGMSGVTAFTHAPTIRDAWAVRGADLQQVGGTDKRLWFFADYDLMTRVQLLRGGYPTIPPNAKINKQEWRVPGGFNKGDREQKRLESALHLLRQYPGGYSMTNNGKTDHGWRVHWTTTLKDMELRTRWNALSA